MLNERGTAMTTIFESLDQRPEECEILQSGYTTLYLQGLCYELALALHEGLGWPMVGLMKEDVIWHAGVRAPDGSIHDIRGPLTEEEFGGYFFSPPFIIRDITANELSDTREIMELGVDQARRLAETLWPKLPWKETHAQNVLAFADELEALSRKRRLWIYGSIPTNLPRVYAACGDEGGYRVCTVLGGSSHTISRYLPIDLNFEEAARLLGED